MTKRTRYTKVKEHREEISRFKEEGKTNQEIADLLGFADKWVVKDFIKRENRKKNRQKPIPNPKGRPRKNPVLSSKELVKENERLKMEKELLRDFLIEIGRG